MDSLFISSVHSSTLGDSYEVIDYPGHGGMKTEEDICKCTCPGCGCNYRPEEYDHTAARALCFRPTLAKPDKPTHVDDTSSDTSCSMSATSFDAHSDTSGTVPTATPCLAKLAQSPTYRDPGQISRDAQQRWLGESDDRPRSLQPQADEDNINPDQTAHSRFGDVNMVDSMQVVHRCSPHESILIVDYETSSPNKSPSASVMLIGTGTFVDDTEDRAHHQL